MSRTINIKGNLLIQNMQIAQDTLDELGLDIEIKNNYFIFNEYDALDQINSKTKENEISKVEKLYKNKFNIYLKQLAYEEQLRIQKEKELLREEKYEKIIQNAKNQGYKVKKEKREDNTIKLVLQKRIY
jgi:beta-glucosidase-like glycosyl hydrolase